MADEDVMENDFADDEYGADELTEDELEAAYRQALEASEAAEETVASAETEGQAVGQGVDDGPADESGEHPKLPPERIVEAALFVGGDPLSGRKLAHLLDLEDGEKKIAAFVETINERYDREGRPYEVRHRDGGYRMVLRNEFEPVRDRLHGKAPKEVRLPADVVALLAVIAYEQPVGPERLGKLGIDSWKSSLRQLVKRGLSEPTDDGYVTTERFLDVFGLRALDEMPRPEGLAVK